MPSGTTLAHKEGWFIPRIALAKYGGITIGVLVGFS